MRQHHALVLVRLADEKQRRQAAQHQHDETEPDIGEPPTVICDQIGNERRNDRRAESHARQCDAERQATLSVEPLRHCEGIADGRQPGAH